MGNAYAVQLGDDLLKTHTPFRRLVEPRWPRGGQSITANEALVALSQASGIPFVWAVEPNTKGRATGVGGYLNETRLNLREGKTTADEALKQILDLKNFRLVFDIGITDGKPTIAPPNADDPDAERARVIEIYEARLGENRFAPLRAEADDSVNALGFLTQAVHDAPTERESITIYDPAPASVPRVASVERAQLLVQSPSRPALQRFLTAWSGHLYEMRTSKVRWHFDVDPLDF